MSAERNQSFESSGPEGEDSIELNFVAAWYVAMLASFGAIAYGFYSKDPNVVKVGVGFGVALAAIGSGLAIRDGLSSS